MNFLDLATVRPILAAAVNLLLVALGLGAASFLPIREYPDIDPPTVSVRTVYPGAQAEIVEREVTRIIEDNLSGIGNTRLIRATSRNESSSINIEFVAGTDIDAAAADVRDKVAGVRRQLPDAVEEPVIEKASADDQPMMWVTLRSERIDTAELTDLAQRRLVDALGAVTGVSRVIIGGEKRYAMRIWLDRQAMAARNVTPGDVADALRRQNLELPAGQLETPTQEITIRAETRLRTASDFAALTLREESGGRVRIGDVARVEIGVENLKGGFRKDGQDAIALGIVRQSNANTLEVADGVRAALDALRQTLPPHVETTVGFDEAIFIRASLANVASTLAQAVGIIILVLYLFLGSLRSTIIPAVTIPASIIPAAIVAAALGLSLNVLTILAVILAISLCIDDVVVIMENIRRRQELGEPLLLASVRATRQVGFAVLVSSWTLVAVILPLAFLQGNVGRLFREFAIVLAAIVLFSTLAALTLGPMLSSRLFTEGQATGRLAGWTSAALGWLSRQYGRALGACIAHPVLTLLAGAAFAAAGIAAFLQVPAELAPDEDRGAVSIVIEGPEGAAAPYMSAQVAEIEKAVASLTGPGEGQPVRTTLAIIVPNFGGAQAPTNTARVIVALKDWNERTLSQGEVLRRLQPLLAPITGVRAFAVNPPKLGQRGGARGLQVAIVGVQRDEVVAWARRVLGPVSLIPGLINPDIDYKNTRPQLSVEIDRDRAAALGIDAQSVGTALQIMFGALDVTRYVDRGEEYEVILQARAQDRATPRDLLNTFVRARNGALVPLSSVVTMRESSTVRELRRIDRLAAVTVEANIGGGQITLGEAIDRFDGIAREQLPAEARVRYLGESLDYQETGYAFLLALGFVLVLVLLLLAGQFESFLSPLIIMVSAPLALAGGVLTLWAFGITLNIYSQIGMILLIGLVAKNAILLVEFANQLREDGRDAADAARQAAMERLRPILMTSAAAVLGAIPLVLERGAGAEARTTIGAITAGGVTLGTLLTLFVVPTIYAMLGRYQSAPGAIAAELQRQQDANGGGRPREE